MVLCSSRSRHGYSEEMPFPLFTERLIIEPLAMHDVEEFVRYRQDPAVARYQSWDTAYSANEARQLIDAQVGVTIPAAGEWVQLAIRGMDDGTLYGDVALRTVDDSVARFEIGFTVASEFQGRGFAREAVNGLLTYLFSACEAQSIQASVDRRNVPSRRLLTALGFECRDDLGWTEEFEGETVQVDVFELANVPSSVGGT